MKYFKYYSNSPVAYVGEYNLAFGSLDAEQIETEQPLVVTPAGIKLYLAKLKECKATYKKLINQFNELLPHEKLSLIKKFYDIDLDKLKAFQLETLKKQFPVEKQIKTTMLTSQNGTYKQAVALVYAKPGVKLSKFKTYSKEEISKLIAEKQIVVVDAFAYGSKSYATCETADILHHEVLAYEFKDMIFDEYALKAMAKKNPEALSSLIYDIDAKQLLSDYETKFLPTYKKLLDFLVKSAKVSVAHNKALEQNLQKQRNKALEENRELEEIKKQIMDTSKGR